LTELRHALTRTKKSLQDRTAELEHARSRAEQYEAEVKKLRLRIEELKQDLATAEDEVSSLVG
jgi:coiled-coil domain-containing protein 102A